MDELSHYGVKGMKWGVRNEDKPSSSNAKSSKTQTKSVSTSQSSINRKELAKKAMIGAGILTVAAGGAFVAYQISKNPKMRMSSLGKPKKAAVDFVKAKEPVGVIHAARGKNVGNHFPRFGGLDDPLKEFERADFDSLLNDDMHRYGDHGEKIAAKFFDPEGRKDRAGRPIFHSVIIPSSMTEGINNIDDVKRNIWPLLKDEYDEMYNRPEDGGYKRFD